MKLPPTYRSHAAALLAAACLAWSVFTPTLRAADEASAPDAGASIEPAHTPPPAPEAPTPSDPAPSAQDPSDLPVEAVESAPADATPAEPTAAQPQQEFVRMRELVTIRHDAHLRAGESTPQMVTILGNAVVDGVVEGDCVTVGGNVTVNGRVRGELVCVGGLVTLGPDAEIRGEVVAVGGGMDVHPSARIRGDKISISIPGLGGFSGWMAEWFQDGLGQARVLPHNHRWAWGAAAMFLLLNVLFAALFGGGVHACARALETRPVFAFINGALVMLLAPVLFVLLSASVIGIPLVPIAVAAIFLSWFVGTIGVFYFCGQQFGLQDKPVVAVLIGNLLFLLLYALPIVGFAVWSVTGVMGLGAAVTAMGNRRREARDAARRAAPPSAAPAPIPPPAYQPQVQVTPTQPVYMAPPAPMAVPQPPVISAGFTGTPAAAGAGAGDAATVPPYSGWTPPVAPPPPAGPSGVTVPPLPVDVVTERATFWARLFAFVLDLLVVTVAINVIGLGWFPVWVLAMLGYHIFFWGWRGSTPAGIIQNLQIVRDDGSPMDYRVAAVRALSAVFSLIPAGMGLIWAAFDRDAQSWHDKLAGTSVVVVRKAKPLI